MPGNWQARFWRPVKRGDPVAEFNKSMRTLFPGAHLGTCLRHALNKLPKKLAALPSPLRKALRSKFHTLLHRARQRKGMRVFALGQRLRHSLNLSEFVDG